MAAQIQRELVELHAFNTAERDLDAWLDTFFGRWQQFTEPLPVYIEAFQRPDPQKMLRYIAQINWYDAGDAVIRWARALQRDTAAPDIGLEEAVEAGRTQSQYAQALHKGMYFVRAASDFFDGHMEKSDLYDTLEIWPEDHRR